LKIVIFTLFILYPDNLLSYSWNNSKASSLVDEAINELYNYKFDNSISLLDRAWLIDNEHPVIPFLQITSKWLKSQTEEGYMSSYLTILSEIEHTVPIYKRLIKKYPNDPEYVLYLGSTYGMNARIALANKEWLSALLSGYSGLKYIRKAEKMDKNLHDVYMPIGFMEYFVCTFPRSIRYGSKLFGLNGNCNSGIDNLQLAIDKSYYSWIEASNVLTYILLYIEKDFYRAEDIISPLLEQYPDHPLFPFLIGEIYIKTSKWSKLEELMPNLDYLSKNGPYYQKNECRLKYYYLRALKAFYNKKYKNCIYYSDFVINTYNMEFDWLLYFCYLLRGKSNDILNKRQLAIADYKKVLNIGSHYPEYKEAKLLLNVPYKENNDPF
tara:strand:+ start:1171 stop:2313 length:1143 start_codon:yes stop_codon:yes gene_type:complete